MPQPNNIIQPPVNPIPPPPINLSPADQLAELQLKIAQKQYQQLLDSEQADLDKKANVERRKKQQYMIDVQNREAEMKKHANCSHIVMNAGRLVTQLAGQRLPQGTMDTDAPGKVLQWVLRCQVCLKRFTNNDPPKDANLWPPDFNMRVGGPSF